MTEKSPLPASSHCATAPGSSAAITVVLLYACFASLWILLSDHAVSLIFHDPGTITLVSTLKGWFFVGITSLLLYLLVRRLLKRTGALFSPAANLRPLLLPGVLLGIVIVAITAGGISHTFTQQQNKEAARLQTIADLKARQIQDWLSERLGDARFVQTSIYFAENYARWRDHGDQAARKTLLTRLESFRSVKSFQAIQLLDEHGKTIWSTDTGTMAVEPLLSTVARKAAADQQVSRLGPYRDAVGQLHLDFIAPLPPVGGKPSPVVILHSDPVNYLFLTLQTWPVPSKSGETLLFRRDGDDVLFMNDLRHKTDAALNLRIPVAKPDLPAAMVLRGEIALNTPLQGNDYRGVPVLVVSRAVEGTDWFLVAKMDLEEVFADSNRDAAWIALAGLLTLFIIAVGGVLFRQRQHLLSSLQEREKQAERLRALQLLDAIANSSTDIIFAKDRIGRYILFNRAAADVTGTTPDAVLGHDDSVLFPPEQAALVMANDQQVMESARVITFQEHLNTPGGRITFLATKGPLRSDEGAIIGIFGISRDISEREKADAALRESEERLHLALKSANMGVWEWNVLTDEVIWSPECYDLFGVTAFGGHLSDFTPMIHPDDVGNVLAVAEQAMQERSIYIVEFRVTRPDGVMLWVTNFARADYESSGKPLRMVGIVQDITRRKLVEEERAALQEQLLQAQKMESVGRLAGGVAHDFNNMLAVIFIAIELIKMKLPPADPLNEHLNEIMSAATRARDITRQLLAFSRKQIISPQIVNLNEFVAHTEKTLSRLIGEDIALTFTPGQSLGSIRIDPSQIDQILMNLAANARDAMPDGGKLTIETANVEFDEAYCRIHGGYRPGRYVQLAVSDTGVGMSEEVREHIFEPFFTTKEVGKGTGLGLATIYGIVQQNHGYIHVYSEPGIGTTFRIYFLRSDHETPVSAESAQEMALRGEGSILLVEDDEILCRVTKATLESLGYFVTATQSPEEALHIAGDPAVHFDLLLTDVVMPGMNGQQLRDRIVEMRPHLKVLFMSGYPSDAITKHGVLDDGVQFLPKPFAVAALAEKLRDMLPERTG